MPDGPAPLEGRAGWSRAWQEPAFRRNAILTVLFLATAVVVQARFLVWNESRSGTALEDPLLALFQPRDFSTVTFAVIWIAIALSAWRLVRLPHLLLHACRGYGLLAFSRVTLMYLVPLDPPETIIPLRDPLVEVFSTGADPLTRDLFFSGHTATLLLLHLVLPAGWLKRALLVCTILVAALTVWQHTHYVIDVLVAPFVAYACFVVAARRRPALRSATQAPAE